MVSRPLNCIPSTKTMKSWLVAYNLPTKSWTSGGTRKDDYDNAACWDVFEVQATYSDEAEDRGRVLRRKHLSCTAKQLALLGKLRLQAGDGRDAVAMAVSKEDATVARQLGDKGLVQFTDPHDQALRLTAAAYNPSLLALGDAAVKIDSALARHPRSR